MSRVFPKIVGVLSVLAAIFGALNATAVLTMLPPNIGVLIGMAAVVTAVLSRELQHTIDLPAAPKLAGWVALAAGVFGGLTAADVVTVFPEKVGAVLLVLASILGAVSKALQSDG